MSGTARTVVAVAGGYLLGRTKKMRMALMMAGLLAGKKLPTSGQDLQDQFGELVKNNPELSRLAEQVQGSLTQAARAAGVALVTQQVNRLSDTLHDRAEAIRPRAADEEDEDSVEPEAPEDEAEDTAGDEPEDEAPEEPEDAAEEEPEDEAPEEPEGDDAAEDAAGAEEKAEEKAEDAAEEAKPRKRASRAKKAPAKRQAAKTAEKAEDTAEEAKPRKRASRAKEPQAAKRQTATKRQAAKKAPAKKAPAKRQSRSMSTSDSGSKR